MSNSQPTHHDAELILKLYDLRREPLMREARNFVPTLAGASFDKFMEVSSAFGTKENAYVRQVYSYWEMVASLIVHGTLNAELANDTLGEMYFAYAMIQPHVEEFRKKMNSPEFLKNVQKVVESTPEGRERLKQISERMKQFAAAAQAKGAKA